MQSLPAFSLDDYRLLLSTAKQRGATFHGVGELPSLTAARNFVCLRHDVDCHPSGTSAMAELEAAEGARATYYVLMTGHYNPRSKTCRPVLRRLAALGHEIGLHYDLSTYPDDPAAAAAHLRAEAAVLADVAEAPVRTISCHFPHKGLPDFFKSSDEFIHCHDPRYTGDVLYVSDSSRGWRDLNMIHWLNADPAASARGLELLTHPEVWFGGHLADRIEYLDQLLMPLVTEEVNQIIGHELREIWLHHDGARMHDERERAAGRL
jgi:peptidoglycan/xylan/chitin deacetylase (PgdA/CDA1 family)